MQGAGGGMFQTERTAGKASEVEADLGCRRNSKKAGGLELEGPGSYLLPSTHVGLNLRT